MFSANENIQLRQYKRRVVGYIEKTMPEEVLDLGTNVMVMQVSCKTPGCVPLETAIVIIFPRSENELLDGLPESAGGSFKSKILKPMADVTEEDVLDALPPAFEGGRKSMELMCLQARDVMLGQITQLFGDDDVTGRKLMAEYLQQSLQDYIENGCQPPEWGEEFETKDKHQVSSTESESTPSSSIEPLIKTTGNVVLPRPSDSEEGMAVSSSSPLPPPSALTANSSTKPSVNSITRIRQQQSAQLRLSGGTSAGSLLSKLAEREHAPGVRRPGCPCCDPDNPSSAMDRFMRL